VTINDIATKFKSFVLFTIDLHDVVVLTNL